MKKHRFDNKTTAFRVGMIIGLFIALTISFASDKLFEYAFGQEPTKDTLKFEQQVANPESAIQAQEENQARWDKAMEFADWEISQGKMFVSECNPLSGICHYGWEFPPDGTFTVINEYTGEERTVRAYCSDDAFYNETSNQCELTEQGKLNEMYREIALGFAIVILAFGIVLYSIRNREKLLKYFNKASEEL